MRHLLNTLFITSEDAYLSLEGEKQGSPVAMCCFVGSNIGWQMMKRKAVRSPAA